MQHYKSIGQIDNLGPGYHHNHSNGHSEHSPKSSHVSVHTDESVVSRTHKQQTTQQVTTVTKVVREVKHLGGTGGSGGNTVDSAVDYVTMPLDVQTLGPDGQPVDYVTMPIGLYPRSQYMSFNQLDQPHHIYVHGGPGSGVPGGGVLNPETNYHSHTYQDYEQYPQYGNSGYDSGGVQQQQNLILGTTSPIASAYDQQSNTPPSPSEHSGSQSPLPQMSNLLNNVSQSNNSSNTAAATATVAYLQTQVGYDEMTDYRITSSPGGPVLDRYTDDPTAMVYGYISATPYGSKGLVGGNGGIGQSNSSYDARAMVYDDNLLNRPQLTAVIGQRGIYDDDDELQQHITNLSVHGHTLMSGHELTSSPGSTTGGTGGNGGNGIIDDEQRHMRWRDPNLTEVISFLNNSNNIIKANAAAYLQHLCYMDDPNKQRTRNLGGIPPLVKLLAHENSDVYRNACGALRNLSYGRQNDENKRAIKNSGGIIALINLLRRTNESEVKELVTGVIWNMSSCEDLKRPIIDDGVTIIVTYIIIPHSGWDPINPGETCWSTVFRNASGVLRNVSSAGEYARMKLRECDGLVDSLIYVIRAAIDKSNIGNKIVENCVCILRNLSYRCQEVEDPNYDKHPLPTQNRVQTSTKGENLGCFGASKKKKDQSSSEQKDAASGINSSTSSGNNSSGNSVGTSVSGGAIGGSGSGTTSRGSIQRQEPLKGYELLWQPDVVQSYLTLLQSCSNPETLEAAAGALQNLAACYWQPSIEIRAAVRKEKGLPILVELLRMEVDRVVCAVATALRNLAIDQRNKELIGKYAMRDLVQKLPSGNPQHDQGTSDDTIAAVLATLNEVIKKNAEFSRSLLDAGGVERLMNITRQRQKYTPRVLKFAGQVLFTMWQHQELRDVYKKHGWKEQDFVTKTIAARNAAPNSPNNANSTLNRPMASQGGTRYEDRTIKRTSQQQQQQQQMVSSSANNGGPSRTANMGPSPIYQRSDEIPLVDIGYPIDQGQQSSGVRLYTQPVLGNGPNHPPSILIAGSNNFEPLYAQINRENKKRRRQLSQTLTTIDLSTVTTKWDPDDDYHNHQNYGIIEEISQQKSNSWI